ncbi:hypothetical protein ACH5RR_037662 [Cinchona calisaya]|uniref:TOD1/MUCI70 glycosyltransferase-like domain-containing protein n=1 Tax=Cinchona calisaya TaxID=153742 RepID=A0ABD2Y854_9GENT
MCLVLTPDVMARPQSFCHIGSFPMSGSLFGLMESFSLLWIHIKFLKEAEANKAAGKYDNISINNRIDFYKKEDVPEECMITREHIPVTDLFTCLWSNEVDHFTSKDRVFQL